MNKNENIQVHQADNTGYMSLKRHKALTVIIETRKI